MVNPRNRRSVVVRSGAKTCRWRLTIERLESRSLLSASGFSSVMASPLVQSLAATTSRYGYAPAQMLQAYGFNQVSFGTVKGNGAGVTIAIVDAYNDPNIAHDLGVFDSTFGLSAPPSFKVVNETGGTSLPTANAGWAEEISLDVEWAHAIAPGANILLVEANSAYYSDLLRAVDTAASKASVVSMSWGGGEFGGESSYDSHFSKTGVTFVASAGDDGAPAIYPAVSPYVVAVGGTSLKLGSGNTWSSETVWDNQYGAGGGGPSLDESRPAYQQSISLPGISSKERLSPDVSYDADPVTGVAVYDSYRTPGWMQFGGTSAGAPQWAALFAIADQGRALAKLAPLGNTAADLYSLSASDFHDITSGSNGYSAGAGYDLASGRGSPYANKVIADLVSANFTSTGTAAAGTGASGSAAHQVGRNAVDGGGFQAPWPQSDAVANSAQAESVFATDAAPAYGATGAAQAQYGNPAVDVAHSAPTDWVAGGLADLGGNDPSAGGEAGGAWDACLRDLSGAVEADGGGSLLA